jgi:hypothetical protein
MPNSWSATNPYFSVTTPRLLSHLPSENSALGRLECFRFADADHVLAGPHRQCESIETDKVEAELAFVEVARLLIIRCGKKSDQLAGSQHAPLLNCLHRNSSCSLCWLPVL